MKLRLLFTAATLLCVSAFAHAASSTKPLRALLITGGCCHDYEFQAKALTEGAKKFGDVTWTVMNEGGKSKDHKSALYDNPNWAKPYDVVVHNECFADVNDIAYVRKITAAHKAGAPAIVIHCAMHTYRGLAEDDWREFLGVTSKRHDHQSEYPVKTMKAGHPVMRDVPANWVSPKDELYIIDKLWPKAQALATSVSEKDGKEYPVIWVNDYHGTRVFGTTYGHGNITWQDPIFIALVSRGLFWAAGRDLK